MASNVRVTVSLPVKQVRQIRRQARDRGLSLSGLMGELVGTGLKPKAALPLKRLRRTGTPLTDACVGAIRLAPGDREKTDRQLLAQALAAKHLHR